MTNYPRIDHADWWRSSVVYQLYVKSFADSDGDGVGDLDGVVEHLDHIAALGVDAVWLNPCYPSPNRDGGYDVADYLTVDERFGGLPAFERLRDACHRRGLRLMMDLVPNHCSDQHAWFQAALAAGPGSPERARFHFAEGRGPDGAEPPNNWRSTFGGPAWTRVPDGQWYLHAFDATQPDFNWEHPAVAEMFDDVLRTWFDRGVDGFRIDVAYAMVKAHGLPDLADPEGENPYLWNQPGVHDIFPRWRKIADSYDPPRNLLGEVWLPPAQIADYLRPGELNQAFYFDLMQQPFEAGAFRASVSATFAALDGAEGVPTWTLNSHDVHRAVSRYGLVEPEPVRSADPNAIRTRARGRVDVALGTCRATAALLFVLALPGSVFLYQGEELGLPEVQDLPDEARQDPIWARSHHTEHGRDGCRVPLPWSSGAPAYGFTTGSAWLPQPDWFAPFAADTQQADPASVWHFYRRAVAAHAELDPGVGLQWLDAGRDDVLAFRRGSVTCVVVFDGEDFVAPEEWGDPLVATRDVAGRSCPAASAAWFRR
ncbi:glycoside hydrolase family 13 protein [Nocardioides sp. BP30]|uniref:glycoside hydrolase family 13 protein n=1 Tax=Nocardioides sp. BP30 TaxID=3036374 RepID=UPI0024694607|nr:glycoside hydrolase family 13 protein [Nocardioides sp. BP30]WGL52173.1 glycoside hydrolase family 13 protein [Nocardioides sp. BP30]